MQITRRNALLGATAAAAVTGLTTAPLTTAPLAIKAATVKAALAINGDTKIERLYADLLQARAIHSEAQDAVYRAHQAAKALYPEPPFPITGTFPTPRFALEALLNKPRVPQAEIIQGLGKLDAYDAECSFIDDKHGVPALDKRNDETYDRMGEIQETLLEVPSVTIRDVLLKLLSENPEGDWEKEIYHDGLHAQVAVVVKRDLERLAGKSRS